MLMVVNFEVAEKLGKRTYDCVYSIPYNTEKYLKQGYRFQMEVMSNSGVLDKCIKETIVLKFPN